jgi:hypothetical protein
MVHAFASLAISQLSAAAEVRNVRYHHDARFGAFSVEVSAPDFRPGYDRLVAASRDDATFLLYPVYDRGRHDRRQDMVQYQKQVQTRQLHLIESDIQRGDQAAQSARSKGESSFRIKFTNSQDAKGLETIKIADWPQRRKSIEGHLAAKREEIRAASSDEGEGSLAVFGRFSRPGRSSIDILLVPAQGTGEPRHLTTVELHFPSDLVAAPEVLASWAEAQADDLREAITLYPGGTALAQYALLRAPDLYGSSKTDLPRLPGREMPDLYGVMTGLAAVQEALQLDAVQRAVNPREGGGVRLDELTGPDIASHDYEALRRGKEPVLFEAAKAIPQENFVIHFTSADATFRVIDLMDDWGTDLGHSIEGVAQDRAVKERFFAQLALPRSSISRLFASSAIEAVSIAGHDPYVREGTDLTLVITAKNLGLVRSALGASRNDAKAKRPDALESQELYGGAAIITVATPDRAISTSYAESGRFAFVGNSAAGVKACIDAAAGRRPPLSAAPDFRYMRTLWDGREDAFVYLSDAFVRGVVGPQWKIGERRRVGCAANLQMIEYGRLLAKRDRQTALSYDELVAAGYVPKELHCAHGGHYTLDSQGARCSVHGRLPYLTPLVELPFQEATATEAAEYQAFVEDYKRYWRQYIDPVGVRVKLGPPLDIETVILPLVDNSIYSGLKEMYGPTPSPLARQGETEKTVAALSTSLAPSPEIRETVSRFIRDLGMTESDPWKWLGDEASLVIYDGDPFLTVGPTVPVGILGEVRHPMAGMVVTALLSSITLPTALVVKVKDAVAARAAVERMAMAWQFQAAANKSRWDQETFSGYRLRDANGGDAVGVLSLTFFGVNLRVYYTVIGDQLYLATRRWLVDEVVKQGTALPRNNSEAEPGHLRVRIEHAHLKSALAAVQAGWGESMRDACFRNLSDLKILHEADAVSDPIANVRQALAYTPYCPAGGRYGIGKHGEPACSVHGTVRAPSQPRELSDATSTAHWIDEFDEIDLALTFTPEGLKTRVRLQPRRK